MGLRKYNLKNVPIKFAMPLSVSSIIYFCDKVVTKSIEELHSMDCHGSVQLESLKNVACLTLRPADDFALPSGVSL